MFKKLMRLSVIFLALSGLAQAINTHVDGEPNPPSNCDWISCDSDDGGN
jgi:hypothetical protein